MSFKKYSSLMRYGELDKRHITSYVSFEKGTLANEDINEGTVEAN